MSDILQGFKPLKEGKIHLKCPGCGRKRSNVDRTSYDPISTVLLETPCLECANGGFSPGIYFDKNGNQILGPFS